MKFENNNKHFTKPEIDAITKAIETARDVSFLETLMDIIPSPIFYKDYKGIYRFCNQAFCDYIGLPKEAIIDHTVYDVAPINLAHIYHQADMDLLQSQEIQIYESKVKFHDGSLHDVIFHKTVHMDDQMTSIGLVGVMVDITRQKNTERLIQRQNVIKDVLIHISHVINQKSDQINFYNLLLDQLVVSFEHVNYGYVYGIKNERVEFLANFGHDHDNLSDYSLPLDSWFINEHAKGIFKDPDVIEQFNEYFGDEVATEMKTIDGRAVQSCIYIPIRLTENKLIILVLESASIAAFSEIDINIAEYIQVQLPIIYKIFSLNKETLQLSRYDTLTGLMNRGYFNTVFEDRLRMADRDKNKLSLIMFDLDGLKIINDNFGHACGDTYLKHFADFIRNQFRSTDTFARIGGDEFLGIFTTTDPITLRKKLTLLQTLYTQLVIEEEDTTFSGRFSYGIATYPDDADTVDGLMTIADIKMYSDKKHYRNNT